MTAKRNGLDKDVLSGIIFVKKNISLLEKHYDTFTKDVNNWPKYEWFNFDVLVDNDVDVGQNIFN